MGKLGGGVMKDGRWSNERKFYMAMRDSCIHFMELADIEAQSLECDELKTGRFHGIAFADDILSIHYAKLFNVLS